jgi:uncharacterized protein (DUF1810 family)
MSLDRFVKAQEKTYASALAELKAGQKRGHWIWWILPQEVRDGLGERALFYALRDKAEARAYLRHPLLGVRYRECIAVIHRQLCLFKVDPLTLMGEEIDVLKLRSSLELFLSVAPAEEDVFRKMARGILEAILSIS